MNDRIKQLLEHLGVSASEFADRLGVQRSSISHILSGRNNPGLEFFQKVLTTYPQVNPDWLLLGSGKITRESFAETSKKKEITPGITEKIVAANNVKMDDIKETKPEEISAGISSPYQIIVLYPDGTFQVYTSRDT